MIGDYLSPEQRDELHLWLEDNGYDDLTEWMRDSDYVYSDEAAEWFLTDGPWSHPVDAELVAWDAMEASTSYEEDQQ